MALSLSQRVNMAAHRASRTRARLLVDGYMRELHNHLMERHIHAICFQFYFFFFELKTVRYRVNKDHIFVIYDYYKPIRIIRAGGRFTAFCEVTNERDGSKCVVKKKLDVFADIRDARRLLCEIKLLMHFTRFGHQDIISLVDLV